MHMIIGIRFSETAKHHRRPLSVRCGERCGNERTKIFCADRYEWRLSHPSCIFTSP